MVHPDKGFGFITPEDGSQDMFAHFSAINSVGFRSLEGNQRVQFEVQEGPKGLQATNVTVLPSPGPDLPWELRGDTALIPRHH